MMASISGRHSKGGDRLRVETFPAQGPDLVQGIVDAAGFPIGARGGEGIEYVADGEENRQVGRWI